MKESRIRHLFNKPGDRQRVRAGLGHVAAGRARIAVAMACYTVWMVACCTGPAIDWGMGGGRLLLPAWLGPIFCMALASFAIAIWFKKTRRVPSSPSWLVAVASLMTLAAVVHLVWALDEGLPVGARRALYILSSVVMGVGGAVFRVEVDRAFGWIGTQQTLYQGMISTAVSAVALAVCAVIGSGVGFGSDGVVFREGGLAGTPLFMVALALPFLSAVLLNGVVKGFPKTRYFGHGREVELPFPTKFVVTSCVQGVAAGVLFMGLFILSGEGDRVASLAGGSGDVLAVVGLSGGVSAAPWFAGEVWRSVGQWVAVGLLFATLVCLRLDFNRLVYKVAFPFVAVGFVLLALLPQLVLVGEVVLAAGFCYLDLVLWSLGACLIKNMGLPATWIASCPGAALFGGVAVGGVVAAVFLGDLATNPALLASFVACFVLASALFLSSSSNLKYGWGTVRPGESGLASGELAGVVQFVATEYAITQRESEVMLLLAEGKSRRAICEELSVSPDTVKTHVRGIYRKLSVHSQQELVDYLAREREDLAADNSERPLEG